MTQECCSNWKSCSQLVAKLLFCNEGSLRSKSQKAHCKMQNLLHFCTQTCTSVWFCLWMFPCFHCGKCTQFFGCSPRQAMADALGFVRCTGLPHQCWNNSLFSPIEMSPIFFAVFTQNQTVELLMSCCCMFMDFFFQFAAAFVALGGSFCTLFWLNFIAQPVTVGQTGSQECCCSAVLGRELAMDISCGMANWLILRCHVEFFPWRVMSQGSSFFHPQQQQQHPRVWKNYLLSCALFVHHVNWSPLPTNALVHFPATATTFLLVCLLLLVVVDVAPHASSALPLESGCQQQ